MHSILVNLFLTINSLFNVYILLCGIWSLLNWFPFFYTTKFSHFLGTYIFPWHKYFRFARIGNLSFAPFAAVVFLIIIQKIFEWAGVMLLHL